MGEAAWHIDPLERCGGEGAAEPASEGGRALAQVDGDIIDGTLDGPDEFCLRHGRKLKMQPAQDTRIFRTRVVVLHEALTVRQGVEERLPVGLKKKATFVPVGLWRKQP